MEKLTITKVAQYDKDKDGKPLEGKFGPYVKCLLKTKEYGDKTISGFLKEKNDWKEGDVIEVNIVQNGEYTNFKLPPKNVSREEFEAVKEDIKTILEAIDKIWEAINSTKAPKTKDSGSNEGFDEF